MTKAKISEYDATAANNTDVNGVNIAEGCPPSGMNNMGREIMAALKRFQTGADGDSVTVGGSLVVSGSVTAANTATLGNVDINGGTIDGATIGGASAAAGSFTTLNTSGAVVFNDAGADVDFRVEGDTEANLLFVDAGNDRVGVGTSSPFARLTVSPESGNFNSTYNDYDGVGLFLLGNGTAGDGNYGPAVVFGACSSTGTEDDKHAAISSVQTSSDANEMGLAFWVHSSNLSTDPLVEAARIDSSGNVGIGTSSPAIRLSGTVLSINDAATASFELANAGSSAGELFANAGGTTLSDYRSLPLIFRTNNTERMRLDASGNLLVGTTTASGKLTVDGDSRLKSTYPISDNVYDIGTASFRWDDVFATNGTIQTSDANEKQDIEALSEAETRVAVAAKGLLKKYRWKSAVAEKGDDARIHFGIIAQDLKAAFEAEGLDAGRYAMFIHSEWWETQTEVPAVEAKEAVYETQTDEEGNEVQVIVSEAVEGKEAYTRTDTYETEAEAPEGAVRKERMGIRYNELLAFIIAAL